MTEAERIAIRLAHYDGVPCWCEQCTKRRLAAAKASGDRVQIAFLCYAAFAAGFIIRGLLS